MSEGIILGCHISINGIQVDQAKVSIIKYLPISCKKKHVRILLFHEIYLIQVDIGGHPPFPTGSKNFLAILVIYYF
jgi:hypothetical protein